MIKAVMPKSETDGNIRGSRVSARSAEAPQLSWTKCSSDSLLVVLATPASTQVQQLTILFSFGQLPTRLISSRFCHAPSTCGFASIIHPRMLMSELTMFYSFYTREVYNTMKNGPLQGPILSVLLPH